MKLTIALVAHDARKNELLEWVDFNKEFLAEHKLVGTGTTSKMIHDRAGLNIEGLKSDPLGGDAQIAAMIAEGKVNCLIFFCDNLATQGHQNDIFGLVHIASLYNIPFAVNRTTADFILTSDILKREDGEYEIKLPRAIENYANRFN